MYRHQGKRWTRSRASGARREELTGTPRHIMRGWDPRCWDQNGALRHYNYNHNQVEMHRCDTWKLTKRTAVAYQQELEKHPANLVACGLKETVMANFRKKMGMQRLIEEGIRQWAWVVLAPRWGDQTDAAKRALEWNLQGKCKRAGDPITPGGARDWKGWRRNGFHGMIKMVLDKTGSGGALVQDLCSTRIGTERIRYRQVT